MLQQIISPQALNVGDIVSVYKQGGLIEHFGVFVGFDVACRPLVVSASGLYEHVVLQTLDDFRDEQNHKYYRVIGRRFDDQVVVERALRALGTRYEVSRANGEHFIRHVHGFPLESPQLRTWSSLAGLALGATAAGIALVRSQPY